MAESKGLLQKFKAIKKIKLGKKRTGVIYKGEDGLFYAGVKSQDQESQNTAPPNEQIEDFEEKESKKGKPSEKEGPKDQEEKDHDEEDEKDEPEQKPSNSLWDKMIEKLGSEDDEQEQEDEESEALRRSKEITPPSEWMPKGVTLDGQMENDISDIDAKQVAWEEQQKKELEKVNANNSKVGMKPGDFIAHPPPDESEYNALYADCSSTIDKMKDKLKFEAKPIAYRRRFIRQGAIMQDAISRAVPMSLAGLEVPNIYRRTVRKVELQDCYIVLLADLSGSMDSWTVKRAFTVVSEACGQWIPDERFALYIFGTNYAKLKAFDESYSKVRYRIGGLEQWRAYDGGGTVMNQPLKHILDYTKKVLPEHKQKVLIVLSDWELSNYGGDSKTHALLTEFIKRNWIVVNLAFGSLGRAKQYPGLAKQCESFETLPKIFFEIYRLISYEGVTHKTFEHLFEKADSEVSA
jgi:hypothetical protein